VVQGTKLQEIGLLSPNNNELLGGGVTKAVSGLSQMVGREIKVTELNITEIPVKNIPDLFGGPEAVIVGVYLVITGHADGYMMLIYKPETAFDLIDLLLGQAQGTTNSITDIEQSVLGEVGNIMGSFFLNYLADTTGFRFMPSPPAVMMDMAGAILGDVMASIMVHTDHTHIVETTFGTCDRQVTGTFLVVPIPGNNE
jgi:chemotaxis protein CheC